MFSGVQIFLLGVILAAECNAYPYRSISSRSVPGRIKASADPDILDEYLSSYLDMVQQHKQQLPYALPEYEPTYQEGYLSRRPPIGPKELAALLPYLSQQSDAGDYNYDYPAESPNPYGDDEGIWYDDAATPQFVGRVETRDENNRQAALIKLFLDHLANKYSLEDLETLERQAALEANTENQLHSLIPLEKAKRPSLRTRPVSRKVMGFPNRQGQKEEPIMVPASSVRRPIATRTVQEKHQAEKVRESTTTAATTSVVSIPVTNEKDEEEELAKLAVHKSEPKDDNDQTLVKTTMEPAMKQAYEAFKNYLDKERSLRQALDESHQHAPQKRFVSYPDSLTQQLVDLNKNVT